jgi:hypothetical protein
VLRAANPTAANEQDVLVLREMLLVTRLVRSAPCLPPGAQHAFASLPLSAQLGMRLRMCRAAEDGASTA